MDTMRAVWYERTGPARDVLTCGEVEIPEPGPGEVRVRIRASGVNPSDTKRRSGWLGLEMPHPRVIPHCDGAGVIDAVGPEVPEDRLGERVWVWNAQGAERPFGTAAEYAVVPAGQAIRLPDGVHFEVGAGLGVPGSTAHYAVFADGPVGGRWILVQGGAGAVGHLAVQLATLGGARVLATASSPEKAAIARAAGAEGVVDYRREDVVARARAWTEGRGVDRIIEVDLAANLAVDLEVLAPNGTIASYSSTSNPEPTLPYYPLAFLDARIHFVQGFLLPPAARRAATRDLTLWLSAGELEVRIGARYPLERTAEAHEAVEGGQGWKVPGKVVVLVGERDERR